MVYVLTILAEWLDKESVFGTISLMWGSEPNWDLFITQDEVIYQNG